jgi:hypothetical protein
VEVGSGITSTTATLRWGQKYLAVASTRRRAVRALGPAGDGAIGVESSVVLLVLRVRVCPVVATTAAESTSSSVRSAVSAFSRGLDSS